MGTSKGAALLPISALQPRLSCLFGRDIAQAPIRFFPVSGARGRCRGRLAAEGRPRIHSNIGGEAMLSARPPYGRAGG